MNADATIKCYYLSLYTGVDVIVFYIVHNNESFIKNDIQINDLLVIHASRPQTQKTLVGQSNKCW